ncbi:hypothetical protein H1R20_g4823, partial [Candolleomyces eurysporus]
MFDASAFDHDKVFLDPDILVQFVDSQIQCDLATSLGKFTISEVLRPYTSEVLVWNVWYKIAPWWRWIFIDPELEDLPELLELLY